MVKTEMNLLNPSRIPLTCRRYIYSQLLELRHRDLPFTILRCSLLIYVAMGFFPLQRCVRQVATSFSAMATIVLSQSRLGTRCQAKVEGRTPVLLAKTDSLRLCVRDRQILGAL